MSKANRLAGGMNGSTASGNQGHRILQRLVAAGPYCGMLLADMGADVIKVEHPQGGDTLRTWPPISDGYSENFASLNRNKRSVTLDLKNPEDIEQAKQLIQSADVVIENNRPGVMNHLGLGYDDIRALKPSIVYCSISAYGQTGPRSQEGGFDLTIQAMSGIIKHHRRTGWRARQMRHAARGFCGGAVAFSVTAALRGVAQTGVGMHISMCRCSAPRSPSLRCRRANTSARDVIRKNSAPRIRATRLIRRSRRAIRISAWRQAI